MSLHEDDTLLLMVMAKLTKNPIDDVMKIYNQMKDDLMRERKSAADAARRQYIKERDQRIQTSDDKIAAADKSGNYKGKDNMDVCAVKDCEVVGRRMLRFCIYCRYSFCNRHVIDQGTKVLCKIEGHVIQTRRYIECNLGGEPILDASDDPQSQGQAGP